LCCLLAGAASAFQRPARAVARSPALAAKPQAKKTGDKPKDAWEVYTDGEYGQAFKWPWETEATDKTAIGHVIPVIAAMALIIPARLEHPF